MKGCPDCDARQKAADDRARAAAREEEARRRSEQTSNDYLVGICGGGMIAGLPVAWLHDWLGWPSKSILMPSMFVGIALGITWVYWRRDKLKRGKGI